MTLLRNILFIFIIFYPFSLSAESIEVTKIPKPLRPWVDWVLYDKDQRHCPYLFNTSSLEKNKQLCAWPSQLELKLTDQGGIFTQHWTIYKKSWVRLPGNKHYWPQDVQSNKQNIVVSHKADYPAIQLSEGQHSITGRFSWNHLPESLYIPPQSGLITLSVNDKTISQPIISQQNRLWLNQNNKRSTTLEDTIDIQVFRKIIDKHPVIVETRIHLRVSGKQRRITLSPVMLANYIPLKISSPLPSQIKQGKLHVQLRPGTWNITVTSRAINNPTHFTLPSSHKPWPKQEVWVYQNSPEIRQVQINNQLSIDASQTTLPKQWKKLPAYLIKSNQTLILKEIHRGIVQTKRDHLVLTRELWLDFDGSDYTFKDQLNGKIHLPKRLDVLPSLQLGRVSLEGQAQLITQIETPNTKKTDTNPITQGIEIRNQVINLTAEGRYTGDINQPPINGWKHKLDSATTHLYLPPGWLLFSVSGTDNIPNSWLQQWTLLDLFLVLIIAVSMTYLFSVYWGALALLTLILIWHQPDTPHIIWLNLLAMVALLRVLPKSWFKTLLHYYYATSLLVLVVLVIPYTIHTVRLAIYPQLEHDQVNTVSNEHKVMINNKVLTEINNNIMTESKAGSKSLIMRQKKRQKSGSSNYSIIKTKLLIQTNPNHSIQTGPGLPNWRWNTITLKWSGPIQSNEKNSMILINPTIISILRIVSIIMLLVLSARVMNYTKRSIVLLKTIKKRYSSLMGYGLYVLLLIPLYSLSPEVSAEIPNAQLLKELQKRLLEAPKCLPHCAQIERMQLTITQDALKIRFKVHANTHTAIPLPGNQTTWLPNEIWLDGSPAEAVQRDSKQQLWLVLTQGIHSVYLSGKAPLVNSFILPLPLKPHLAQWQSNHWFVNGIHKNGTIDNQLKLTRSKTNNNQSLMSNDNQLLPPLLSITRRLNLGLEWFVETSVKRLSNRGQPISLQVPLLIGEQPLSEKFPVNKGKITLNLKSQQNSLRWISKLKPTNTITLTSLDSINYIENWQIATSPLWHISAKGIPINRVTNNHSNTLVYHWNPWPKEQLTLSIQRPKGVKGQKVTLLKHHLSIKAGKRSNDITLSLTLRSSQGIRHQITLPKGIVLKTLSINNNSQAIQQKGQHVTLHLKPGEQTVTMNWQDNIAIHHYYQFPNIDLGLPSVNNQYTLQLTREHWVLFAGGPQLGPAILFWGVLAALLVLSLMLGISQLTPLKSWQWFLLGIGLTQTTPYLMIIVVLWLLMISSREKISMPRNRFAFNALQISLIIMTFLALSALVIAVGKGLLGYPEMQIAGNGSTSQLLKWYEDRHSGVLAQPWILSIPLFIYRLLMLAWALWLSISVLKWLRWGWSALSQEHLWIKKTKLIETK